MSENIVYTFGGVVSEESPFAFVESTDEERAEMDVPELFVDGFEAEAAAGERVGDEERVTFPFDVAVARDAAHPERGVVVDRRRCGWEGPAQSGETRGRSIQVDAFVGPVVVVHRTERIEASLLLTKAACLISREALLERAVHPFVAAVVLGITRDDEDRLHTELHQTHAEGREPAEAMSAEGRTVVAEQGIGQTVIAKDAYQDRPHAAQADRRQCLADEQVPTHRLGHGQRMAPPAVAQTELAFEVDRGQLARQTRLVASLARRVGARAGQLPSGRSSISRRRIFFDPKWNRCRSAITRSAIHSAVRRGECGARPRSTRSARP